MIILIMNYSGKCDIEEVNLGGCVATDLDPGYNCNKCNYDWNKDNPHSGDFSDSS